MTTNNLLRVMATVLCFTVACKGDFAAGITGNGKDGSAQETGTLQDGGNPNPQEAGPSTVTGSVSCDPFQPATKPVTLTNVIGAGQDTDGTLYVVDQPQPGGERVFATSGGTLQRQRIAGSGTEGNANGGSSYTFAISDHVPPFTIKLETNTAGPTAMGVLQNPPPDIKTFTIGQQGDVLTLVPASQVAALAVANIPAATYIECNATVPDGRGLLVVRPLDDWTLTDFRVFFGTADRMLERPVDRVDIFVGGDSGIVVDFAIDGVAAVANCAATLTIGNTAFPLTLGPTDSPPAGESYFCLGNPSPDGGVDAWVPAADGPPVCRALSPDYGCPDAGVGDGGNDAGPALQGIFAPTGSMTVARMGHTATLLPSGKVLIAGGVDSVFSAGLASAELYDPVAGTFTATGDMTVARGTEHTATLLATGKVLIAGGHDDTNDLASAELYDPAAGTFTATGSMSVGRAYPTATLLVNRKVLIAGGAGSNAELYDPTTGIFTATGMMTAARTEQTATLLASGKVLVTGGFDYVSLASAELYDPTAGTFTATGSMIAARYCHTATRLPSGEVLIAGGYDSGYLASAELYDPTAGTFTTVGSMTAGRVSHTATLLGNGNVLIAGGDVSDRASAELYDSSTGTFSATTDMLAPRADPTAALLGSGKVLITGGMSITGDAWVDLASAELYQ